MARAPPVCRQPPCKLRAMANLNQTSRQRLHKLHCLPRGRHRRLDGMVREPCHTTRHTVRRDTRAPRHGESNKCLFHVRTGPPHGQDNNLTGPHVHGGHACRGMRGGAGGGGGGVQPAGQHERHGVLGADGGARGGHADGLCPGLLVRRWATGTTTTTTTERRERE